MTLVHKISAKGHFRLLLIAKCKNTLNPLNAVWIRIAATSSSGRLTDTRRPLATPLIIFFCSSLDRDFKIKPFVSGNELSCKNCSVRKDIHK